MIVAFARASSSDFKIYRDVKGSHLFLLYNFYVKMCFFRSFSHNARTKQRTMKTMSKV